MAKKVWVLDTTLRDGEQAPGFSMRVQEKLRVAKALENLNVDVIEAGFPASSQNDFDAVRAVAAAVKNASVCGICRATPGDIERTWDALRHAAHPRIHIFLATSDIHLTHKLQLERREVLERAREAVRLAKSHCADVQFTAEDATRTDRDFLMEVFTAVEREGATTLSIADTVGYAVPQEMAELVAFVKAGLLPQTRLSVHCHNDLGMAAANTLSAIKAGADQFDGTLTGIGERAGMAAVEEVVMALRTRSDYYGADTGVNATGFVEASRTLSAVVDMKVQRHKAIVGENAFAHEAGVHQHGIMANPLTYEIMKPGDVGASSSRLVLGRHSGRAALRERLSELGYRLDGEELEKAFGRFREMAESRKVIGDADLEALVRADLQESVCAGDRERPASGALVRMVYSRIGLKL